MAAPEVPIRRSTPAQLRVDQLLLDPENPRLVMGENPSQLDLARTLYEAEGVDELVSSLVQNGYFDEEPLVVVPADDEKYVVVEGNRRLTTLKLLLDKTLRSKIDVEGWPKLTDAQRSRLTEVPCVIYPNRDEVLPFLGFRHITGAKKWAPYQKARFVSQLLRRGDTIDYIQDLIGDTTSTVKKLYQQYVVFEQVRYELDIPDKPIRERFSLLEVVLGQRSVKAFLGMPPSLPTGPVERVVPEEKIAELGEVIGWVFGAPDKIAVISDSRDINRLLAPVIAKPEALNYLRATNDLVGAFDFSGGEKEYLLKRIAMAERAIRDIAGFLAVHASDPDIRSGIDRLELQIQGLRRLAG